MVEVNRDYEVKLNDVRKPFVASALPDSLQSFNIGFDYSIFNRPIGDLYDFKPRQVAALERVSNDGNPHFSAVLGYQFPLAPKADLYFQHAKETYELGASGHYDLFKGDVAGVLGINDISSFRQHADAGAYTKFIWKTGEVKLDASYHMNRVSDFSHTQESTVFNADNNMLKVDLSLKSANSDPKSFFYDGQVSYRKASQNANYNENVLAVNARLGSSFDEHRIYLDISTENCWYQENNSIGIVEFTPIYQYHKGAVDAKVGLKFSSLYGLYEGTKIHPYLDAKVELIGNTLWLHGTADGGNYIESLCDFANMTPWLRMQPYGPDDKLQFGDTKLDTKFAVETKLFKHLSLNLYESYSMYDNKLVPYPSDLPVLALRPHYSSYNKLTTGVELAFASKDFNLIGSFRYNIYNSADENKLYFLPQYEAFVEANYNLHNKLLVSAHFNYRSQTDCVPVIEYLDEHQLPSYLDLGLKIQYNILPNIAVFAKAGNLTGGENYLYPYKGGMPRNFGGGICIDF